MHRFYFSVIIAFFFLQFSLNAQFVVTDLSDLPDLDEFDGIYEPKTLRSAIQNASRIYGVPQSITIYPDGSTIKLLSDLPSMSHNQVTFDGKGLILEPASNSTATIGLGIGGNNFILRNVLIQGFSSIGLDWEGSDGLIESTICRNNGVNLRMRHADRNTIGGVLGHYFSNSFYGGKNNTGSGISLDDQCEDNIIQYCSIGVDETGAEKPNLSEGILVEGYRTIIKNNVIGGNEKEGIRISYGNEALFTHIENNLIGVNNSGQTVPNKFGGIRIIGSSGDSIINNVISGNIGTGISGISVDAGKNITIENNKIGTDYSTKNSLPNYNGIYLGGSEHIVRNNVVSGNASVGIYVGAPNSIIQSNIVGLDSEQRIPVPNGRGLIVACSNIVIGDITGNTSNVVAGNNGNGINVIGSNTQNIEVTNNFIGTNNDESLKLPNKGSGILLSFNVRAALIGNNTISSSGEHGVRLERDVVVFDDGTPTLYRKPSFIQIYRNEFVGEFGGSGISIFNADSIFINANRIDGTKENGISIENDSTRHIFIYNNQIGTHFGQPGVQKIGNNGIYIKDAKNVLIGGNLIETDSNTIVNCKGSGISTLDADSVFIEDNYIGGIEENGISIAGLSSDFIRIKRNHIGPETDTFDEQKIGGDGIFVEDAIDVLIGSQVIPSDSNTIKYCKGYAVFIHNEAEQVYVFGNSMIENQMGGINIDNLELYFAFGFSNDSLDLDIGANGLQNTPVMEIADAEGASVLIKGEFLGSANTTYRIDAYLAKELADSIQYQTQGSIYLDWFAVKTDDEGIAKIDTSWSNAKIATYSNEFPFVTLTASGVEGTSCFSILAKADLYVDIQTKIDTSRTFVDNNGNITLVATITNRGTDNVTTIAVRDTVSAFDLKSVTISKGTAIIADSTFVATIPSLGSGESVEYTAYGKSKVIGQHQRRIVAFPSEWDIYPVNNADTITLNVPFVNSIENENYEKPEISLMIDNKAKITGHGGGNIIVRLYNLLGQLYAESRYVVLPEQELETVLNNKITLVEVLRDNKKIISKLLCSW